MKQKNFEQDDKNLSFINMNEAVEPFHGLHMIHKDRWWIKHPTKGIIFFRGVAQCNSEQQYAEILRVSNYPWAELVFLPWVYVPYSPTRPTLCAV